MQTVGELAGVACLKFYFFLPMEFDFHAVAEVAMQPLDEFDLVKNTSDEKVSF